jgi:hypothetical protein
VLFGCDREQLHVRLDGVRAMTELLAEGYEFTIDFLQPAGLRFSVRAGAGRLEWAYRGQPLAGSDRPRGAWPSAAVAAGSVIEVQLPLAALGVSPGHPIEFVVSVSGGGSGSSGSRGMDRPIRVTLPDGAFEARHWSA